MTYFSSIDLGLHNGITTVEAAAILDILPESFSIAEQRVCCVRYHPFCLTFVDEVLNLTRSSVLMMPQILKFPLSYRKTENRMHIGTPE
jgi:hypothetical protein